MMTLKTMRDYIQAYVIIAGIFHTYNITKRNKQSTRCETLQMLKINW